MSKTKKVRTPEQKAAAAVKRAETIAKNAAEAKAKENLTPCKRFVIAVNRLGKNQVIEFTNKEGKVMVYNHDKVYNALKAKFDAMPCFQKYKSYTNTNNLPVFVRELKEIV